MKKFLLLYIVVIFFGNEAFSQLKIGLRFSPALSINRALDRDLADPYTINPSGVGIRFFAGPEVSVFFGGGDNYSFVTGLWYASKRAGLRVFVPDSQNPVVNEVYNLQYLQIPLTLRLFTNEIATNKRIYFQLGGVGEIKLAERPVKAPTTPFVNNFRFFDTSILFGSGMQFQLGGNTYLLAGLSYMRGIVGTVTRTSNIANNGQLLVNPSPTFKLNNDMISLDLGVRF